LVIDPHSDDTTHDAPAHAEALLDRLSSRRAAHLAYLAARTRPPVDVEDVLQDASLKAFQNIASLRDPEHLDAWFYSILDHTLTDYGRALKRARTDALTDPDQLIAPPKSVPKPACACGTHLLTEIKPAYAEVLRRVVLGGETTDAAADALGVSRGNLWVRLHRARAALRKRLEAHCNFAPRSLECSCACGLKDGCCAP